MSFRCSALGSRSRGDTALSIVAPAWGIFLADTVRRIANAFQEQYGQPVPHSISAILESLYNVLGDPTSAVRGEFSHSHR